MHDSVTGEPPLDALFSAAYDQLRRLASMVKSDDPRGIVSRQTSPSVSWLKAAQDDLVTLHDATHKPDQAAKFRVKSNTS